MARPTTALITGATGYVGSKLCERLLNDGWHVIAVLREHGNSLPPSLAGRIAEIRHDGRTEHLVQQLSAAKPDIVFHLASLFIAEHRTEQVSDLINSNVLFGTQLLEACAHAGVKQFINTGTSWQHYRSETYDPVCLYAATKQAFEDVLRFYVDAYDMKAATLYIYDTYGPDDPRAKIVKLLLRAAASGEPLGMSPGEQGLNLVHIDDVTRAFECAAAHLHQTIAATHERYAIRADTSLSLQALGALVSSLPGSRLQVSFGARPYRKREVMTPLQFAPNVPGWAPQIPLADGLRTLFTASVSP